MLQSCGLIRASGTLTQIGTRRLAEVFFTEVFFTVWSEDILLRNQQQ
jgi:hypothetical protein